MTTSGPRAAGLRLVEEEAAALVPEPLDQRRRRRGPAQRLQRERPERVDQRSRRGPGRRASRIRRASKPSRRLRWTSSGKPIRPLARRPQTGSNFGEASRPGLVGLDDPEQPVALEVAVARASQSTWARDPRLLGRVADGDPPGPGQQRRLDRLGLEGAARGDVVEGQPRPGDRPVPEDRVADEAVRALRGEQALQLGPRARRARSGARRSPRSRSPSTTARGSGRGSARCRRSGVAVALALEPVLAQDPLGDLDDARSRALRHAVRRISRSASAPRTRQQPGSASEPRPGFGPGDAADEALPRGFDHLGHRVDLGDLLAATAAAAPAARRRWWSGSAPSSPPASAAPPTGS